MQNIKHNELVGDLLTETVMEKAVQDKMAQHQREQQQQQHNGQHQSNQNQNDSMDEFEEMMNDPEAQKIMMQRHREYMEDIKADQIKKKKEQNNIAQGEYRQIKEDEFLPLVTKNDDCIVHFCHKDFERCKIIDLHLNIIAKMHGETKIVSLDVEKAPFFVQKLQIQMLPCVVMFKKGVAIERIVGFEDLGGTDNFKSSLLARKFIQAGVMKARYPEEKQKVNLKTRGGHNQYYDSEESDQDY